jgi:uncharacterized coiled-coil protein SlyX
MNFEFDIGTAIGTAATIGAGIVTWMRANRVSNAKAAADVAVHHNEEAKHDGQAAEIERLSKTLAEVSKTQAEQAKRLSHLEARFVGVEAHFQSLALCDPCREKNASIIARLIEALKI